ncbi:MAG TPA: hypothetical protein DCZ10_14280, partial [Pelotomaculum sp.]|nr:hypothetical protein [Pelotomaculum sp.]
MKQRRTPLYPMRIKRVPTTMAGAMAAVAGIQVTVRQGSGGSAARDYITIKFKGVKEMKIARNERGFTLIELMVVLII